jgi:hypothetical protein
LDRENFQRKYIDLDHSTVEMEQKHHAMVALSVSDLGPHTVMFLGHNRFPLKLVVEGQYSTTKPDFRPMRQIEYLNTNRTRIDPEILELQEDKENSRSKHRQLDHSTEGTRPPRRAMELLLWWDL